MADLTDAEIAELRKLLREARTEIRDFREAVPDLMLTAKAREVLPRLLDELDRLRRLTRYSAVIKNVGEKRETVLLVGSPLHVKPIKE